MSNPTTRTYIYMWLRYLLHFPFLQVKIFDYYNNSEYDTRCLYQYYCKNTMKINDLISEPVGIRAQNLFMRYFLMQHRKWFFILYIENSFMNTTIVWLKIIPTWMIINLDKWVCHIMVSSSRTAVSHYKFPLVQLYIVQLYYLWLK